MSNTRNAPTLAQKIALRAHGLNPALFTQEQAAARLAELRERPEGSGSGGGEATSGGDAGEEDGSPEGRNEQPTEQEPDPDQDPAEGQGDGDDSDDGDDQDQQDPQGKDQGDDMSNDKQQAQPKKGSLAALAQQQRQSQRPQMSRQTIRDAIERALDDSPTLKERVWQVINEHKEELSDVLGVPEQIEAAVGEIDQEFREAVERVRAEMGLMLMLDTGTGEEPVVIEGCHYAFPELVQVVFQDQEWPYLQGPSGAGKTTAAELLADVAAERFGRDRSEYGVYIISGSPHISKTDVIGYRDGGGFVQDTPLTVPWKNGGVVLLDELPKWHDQVLGMVNAALVQGVIALPHPDGGMRMVPRHPHCIIMSAGNTDMAQLSQAYSDRTQGGAERNRWQVIPWGYDPNIERAMAGDDPFGWLDHVRALREAATMLNREDLEPQFSPHQIRRGLKLLRRGIPWQEVCERTVFWGIDGDTQNELLSQAGRRSFRGEITHQQYLERVARRRERDAEREEADRELVAAD